jgi:hypothetical protein
METFDAQPEFQVQDAEYLRLLGYPRGHEPGGRVQELMAWARDWYARNGRPWAYHRRVDLQAGGGTLWLGGVEFVSPRLQEHFRHHGATGAVLVAVSAGAECEEHARELWNEGKPDEYFMLEIYGSAVVEDLVARTSGRLCGIAEHDGLMAVPHYSPGYAGWDVAEQNRLHALIVKGMNGVLPGPLEVLQWHAATEEIASRSLRLGTERRASGRAGHPVRRLLVFAMSLSACAVSSCH